MISDEEEETNDEDSEQESLASALDSPINGVYPVHLDQAFESFLNQIRQRRPDQILIMQISPDGSAKVGIGDRWEEGDSLQQALESMYFSAH